MVGVLYFSDSPHIVTPPTPVIISLESTHTVEFSCTAVGGLPLDIAWRHNSAKAILSLKYHTNQSTPMPDPQGRDFIRTGTLSIFNLNEMDTGWVECVVGEESTGVPQDIVGTRLSILGKRARRDNYSQTCGNNSQI